MNLRCALLLIAATATLSSACSSPTAPSTGVLRLTGVAPSAGSTTSDTEVTLSGSGFQPGVAVTVGGVPVSRVTVNTDTVLQITVPARLSAGAVDVVVTSGGHTTTLPRGFTFVAPSGANQPPIIARLRSVGSRRNQPSGFADVGETIVLDAQVSNVEGTALTYTWTGQGTFNGTGPSVAWTAPSTPSTVGLSLTVTERYDEGGVTHINATSSTIPVRVHDSQQEILDLGEDFLSLFSRNEVPTDAVLHSFSTSCDAGKGRRDEAGDTDAARRKYRQDFSRFRITRLPPVTFNFGAACIAFGTRIRPADACSLFKVHWEFTYLVDEENHKAGDQGITDGIDHVTAVLESGEWKLCHSDFQ